MLPRDNTFCDECEAERSLAHASRTTFSLPQQLHTFVIIACSHDVRPIIRTNAQHLRCAIVTTSALKSEIQSNRGREPDDAALHPD